MKQKIGNKRKYRTRKHFMYGGQSIPRPAPSPSPAFQGFNYSDTELKSALNNYLISAYSIKQAANAIKDTSIFQNIVDPTNVNPGTRFLQRNSSTSFKEAAVAIKESLGRFYGGITGVTAPLTTPTAPPPLGNPPYPPFSLGASYIY